MPKHVEIFYFTGTGNTKIVAELFKEGFESNSCIVSLKSINCKLLKNGIALPENADLLGIGYPVHAFDAPEIMYDFVRALPEGNGIKAFVFKTAADCLRVNVDSSGHLVKALAAKGYNVFYDEILVMPSNFIIRFKPEIEKQFYSTAVRKVKRMTDEILKGKRRIESPRLFSRIMQFVFKLEKVGCKRFGKSLKASSNCNLCKKCINHCPSANISIKSEKIKFNGSCLLCMKCMYECPQKAIQPGRMKFVMIKDGYDFERVINNPNIKEEYITSSTKGYFKHYFRYISGD